MTDKYAVVGNPIEHSISPLIHNLFAKELGHDISYEKIFSPIAEFNEVVSSFQKNGGLGMNVTVPFKQAASQLAVTCSERVCESGVANVLVLKRNTILADNTDGIGLLIDLQHNLRLSIRGKDVLLLGAGGAANGVIGPILREKPRTLTVANRTVSKALLLVDRYSVNYPAIFGISLNEIAGREYHLVINATSSSLKGNTLELPAGLFAPDSLAYDMMYGEHTNDFLKRCSEKGAKRTSDGIGMLVEQAAESFFIWRNVRPTTLGVINKLRQARF